ncbi:uncharacterized protein OCT59_020010 [Rhizophagus irregularis]|uniref:Uncharacterized protein n=2 Tax=Rhizophagus irregularis TaxID=588596 RepID=A0A015LW70_RHIIW|nr:hypothetical protein GLOIN_2v1801701 [Rhizophagus irregularis DAOM 181602=DAOM 197198]EXX76961.1 hypothetical protein RirG_028200 [Rhizophagus irregularis DAOM 197198w]UZO27823.1 hypothetical protein OCT59_020010 [Rhizophagus irregularis]POG66878.1 hypothetical protein GLOIN_2v1801701 [Rhizophagus irregularis DAOM 181602=DAOM 197198]CAG8700743.1 18132_t:CDS:1 [Rhizophagus irregularis]GBC25588.1 hypothetical protein GLOIN_2v1801701 [Rhizophagus irregularis DAOM 181602=DAOM 197198]|eukprot:XP_025173744.1 hypothetical protein GLOIN_2v1801701 [Rhizophagus irregularis DAOM 181602=DAOM 197198]
MGTRGVILIRTRKPKRKEMSVMGEPAGSQYFYEYYVCIYQHFDGYVKGGLGEWLANFLYEFTHNLSTYPDTGLLATRLIEGLYSSNFFVNPRLVPIAPLEEMFHSDYDYVYIITVSCDSNLGLNDKSIMLSVCYYREFILTARPEKFLEKYKYYITQIKENNKSFAEISYDDDEVEKNGYLSEDQLLIKFLKEIP